MSRGVQVVRVGVGQAEGILICIGSRFWLWQGEAALKAPLQLRRLGVVHGRW